MKNRENFDSTSKDRRYRYKYRNRQGQNRQDIKNDSPDQVSSYAYEDNKGSVEPLEPAENNPEDDKEYAEYENNDQGQKQQQDEQLVENRRNDLGPKPERTTGGQDYGNDYFYPNYQLEDNNKEQSTNFASNSNRMNFRRQPSMTNRKGIPHYEYGDYYADSKSVENDITDNRIAQDRAQYYVNDQDSSDNDITKEGRSVSNR